MTDLLIMLAIGAVISCIFGVILQDTTAGFLMRLVFTSAVQVIIWYLLGAE